MVSGCALPEIGEKHGEWERWYREGDGGGEGGGGNRAPENLKFDGN